jgi:DNA-binding protein HU-beta
MIEGRLKIKIQEEDQSMNKAELVDALAAQASEAKLTKKQVEAVLKAFIDVVTDELKKGEKVQLVGFGTFETVERAERKGRNPQTKKEITIPASKAPKFKAGKGLKDAVNVAPSKKSKKKK